MVLAVTSLGIFLVGLDLSIVNVAFPSILASFPEATRAQLSWVINAYTVVFAGLMIVAGRIADRVGRKRVFIAGLALFVLTSILVAVAPSPGLLITARALQGTGAALLTPASLGLLLAGWPAARRATAVSIWGAVTAVAVAVGPSLGAWIIDTASWRWAFLVNVPVGAVLLLRAPSLLDEVEPDRSGPNPDTVGAVLISVATGLVALAIIQSRTWGVATVTTVLLAALGVLTLLIRRTRRHPAPIVEPSLLQIRSFTAANLALLLFGVAFFGAFLAFVLFLTAVWGYSVLQAGLAITPGPMVVAVMAPLSGRLADRVGYRRVALTGILFYAAAMAWYLLIPDSTPDYLTEWLPAVIMTGLGVAATLPILAGAAVSAVPPRSFSVAGAVNQTARQIGSVLGVALTVALLGEADTLAAYRHVYVAALIATLGSAIIAT